MADAGSPAGGPARAAAAAVLRNELGDLKDERKQLKRTLKEVSKNIRNEDLRKVCSGALKPYGTHSIYICRCCIYVWIILIDTQIYIYIYLCIYSLSPFFKGISSKILDCKFR